MLTKIQSAIFQYIAEIFSSYGVPVLFKYNEDLDVIDEWRRAQDHIAKHKELPQGLSTSTEQKSEYSSILNARYGTCLGIFSRSPIIKDPNMLGNLCTEVNTPNKTNKKVLDFHGWMRAVINYNVSLVFNNHDLADIIEVLYLMDIQDSPQTVYCDFSFGEDFEPITDVPYYINWGDLDSVGKVNTSNLRRINFGFQVSGPLFSGFYRNETRIEELRLDVHGFWQEQPIKYTLHWKNTQEAKAHRLFKYGVVGVLEDEDNLPTSRENIKDELEGYQG